MKLKPKIISIVFIFACIAFSIPNAQSQILISSLLGDKLNSGKMEFGMDGGFNRSWMTGIDQSKGLTNFHLGSILTLH